MVDVATQSWSFGAADAKLFEITADTLSAYTVGTAVDIPGIKNFSSNPELKSTDLTGDGVVMDSFAKTINGVFSFECAKTDFPLLVVLLGGRYRTNTTAATFSLQKGDNPKPFQMAIKPEGIEIPNGSAALHLMKCKVESITSGASEDAFDTIKVSGKTFFTVKQFTRNTGLPDAKTAGLMQDTKFYAADTAITAITT